MKFRFSLQGYVSRMKVYLDEMFPVLLRLGYSILLFISSVLFLQRIHGVERALLPLHSFVGVSSIFSLLLILRLMDELKDKDIDRELFRERPLPSGRVMESDIWLSLGVAVLFYLCVNLLIPLTFWISMGVLAYATLMFRYFFIPNILRRNLLLNLATHNPIIPIMLLYIVSVFAAQHGLGIKELDWVSITIIILMYWSVSFAWEISRKIRSKEEENAYVTYSQIFGRVGAIVVAGGAQTGALIIAISLSVRFSVSWFYLAFLILAYGATMFGHVRFLIRPNPATSKLKPFAERYALAVLIANTIAYGVIMQ